MNILKDTSLESNPYLKIDGVNLLSVGKDERTPNEIGFVLELHTSYPFYQNRSNVAYLLTYGQGFPDRQTVERDAHPFFICRCYKLIPRVFPPYLFLFYHTFRACCFQIRHFHFTEVFYKIYYLFAAVVFHKSSEAKQ